ncbi:RDD family protein [Acetonema longum]|uniref:RDD domain-containing protein n=1 Tax=Acetonema longum DSM 6540 TaxID=1009370 RepID=F7NG72_9FIRM|nr:RDD family protein [Acetonema longum]EGO64990.1 RDD domain-containing protein [Acetonema longum DSM 6540]
MLHIRTLQSASMIRRFAAFCIDHMLIGLSMIFVILWEMDFENGDMNDLMRITTISMLFGILLITIKDCVNGVSPGRWLLRLAVRNIGNHNEIPAIGKLMLRNVFTVIWPLDLLTLIFYGRRIGDIAAETDIVLCPDRRSLAKRMAVTAIPVIVMIGFISLVTINVLEADS